MGGKLLGATPVQLYDGERIAEVICKSLPADYWPYFKLCGSLRRKHKLCGDIDLAIWTPDDTDDLWNILMDQLGIEFDYFAGNGSVKSALSFLYEDHQIDVYTVRKIDEFSALTLFLTGSAKLNITMRSKAESLGWMLNQYGLFEPAKDGRVDYVAKAGKSQWTRLAGVVDEHDYFTKLGMTYLEPEDRDV